MTIVIPLLGIALAVLAAYIASRPTEFGISRSIEIAAPPSVVFPLINDLHAWDGWSPWAKLDPKATSSFSGTDVGPGSSFAWDGNNQVGKGRMTIANSKPNDHVELRLDFEKPMRATNVARFVLQPTAHGTRVTWTMTGNNNFAAKAVNLVIDCDKMVGGMFDKGLASLKQVAEASVRI